MNGNIFVDTNVLVYSRDASKLDKQTRASERISHLWKSGTGRLSMQVIAVPGHQQIVIFDRTWYGRVLVERVEGFCTEADWMRAYDEINEFEEQLVANGAVICKFWLQISKDEQLRRFQEREQTGFKRFKITPEDWRNREKWEAYEQAVADMVDRTSTRLAPWTLVEANDKYFARVKVLRTVCRALHASL